MAHNALGRGLNALFSQTQTGVAPLDPTIPLTFSPNEIHNIALSSIKPNRHQPRQMFNEDSLKELAESIKRHGLAQPLVVTETTVKGEYELVAGERRLRASKIAGLPTVPCILKKLTNRERFELALVENIQREDLNAYEEAVALDGLMKEFTLTQEQVAEAIGKSRSAVANVLRLLKLHENVQSALRSGIISEGHAKCLAGLPDHADQLRWLDEITNQKLTVRDLEHLLATAREKKAVPKERAASEKNIEVKKFEEAFQQKLGRRVEIQTKGKGGSLKVAFYNPDDFEVLCQTLGLLPKK